MCVVRSVLIERAVDGTARHKINTVYVGSVRICAKVSAAKINSRSKQLGGLAELYRFRWVLVNGE